MQDEAPYTIRLGKPEDADAIAQLTHAAYSKWIKLIGRNPLPMDVDYHAAVKTHRFDLLYKGDVLAALIETYETLESLFLENLCVSPDFQRQGLGKKMLARTEDIAVSLGKPVIQLDTNSFFTGNVALYRSLGYVTEWEKPSDVGMHVRMQKRL